MLHRSLLSVINAPHVPRLHLGETNCSPRAASQRRVLGRGDFQLACLC